MAERQDPEEAVNLPCLPSDNRVEEEALQEDQEEKFYIALVQKKTELLTFMCHQFMLRLLLLLFGLVGKYV